ncbi:MAG: hypothetical protein H6654_07160 [Ardenticatenaceae bacterium]|nr:hypothetical protein [Anaerolineales bacterium]MCB8940304.1 hypothetical protein [Ardenticatenaceae bacterium]MCB8973319.1 hypothetical protein [Ardenticatenaceae bacterium]
MKHSSKQLSTQSDLPQDIRSPFIRRAGTILAVSYPVLALSTGFRSVYQLFLKEGVASYTGPALSAVAALCYLTATIGFAYRRRWAWWLSVLVLGFESLMTLIVGTLSIINPELVGSTVWRWFGIDYGFFPLLQPLLGLAWLFHPETLQSYGIRPSPPTSE